MKKKYKSEKLKEVQNLKDFKLPKNFRGRPAWFVQIWWLVQGTLFRWSPQFFYGWRRFLLRLFGAKIGYKVLVRPTVIVTYPWKLSIDDYSWIGDDVTLYTLGEISIGSNSVISQKSYICTGSHKINSNSFDIFEHKIEIGSRVWIASDVFVAPGTSIGEGCVVGARSSVFTDLPENTICYGNPAIVRRSRFLD